MKPLSQLSLFGFFQSTKVATQTKKQKQVWVGWLSGLSLSIPFAICNPVFGAERLYVSYSTLERSISIEALEIYAKEGKITDELAPYTRYLTSQQLAQFRTGLRTRINLDPVTISQFLYTLPGERLLQRFGQIVQTQSRQSGFYAIRAALISAAATSEGLTGLNVLRRFPAQGIRVDVTQALGLLREVERLVNQTTAAVAAVRNDPSEMAIESQVQRSQLADLGAQGPFTWQKKMLRVSLSSTARTSLVDVYLPKVNVPDTAAWHPSPLIVFSGGLISERTVYGYLAEHLASYGFAVVVPELPDSGSQQWQASRKGLADAYTDPAKFVKRPLNVKGLLDELSQRSRSDPTLRGRLNLQQVGVIGYSFGGYTALTLAGGKINFVQLQKDCGPKLGNTLNLSLLFQCQALALPKHDYKLSDPRIKAAIAISPMDSSVLGQSSLSQIKIPVMLVGGSADTTTPALLELIRPFTWLTTPHKYLMLIEGGTHFSTRGESAVGASVFPTSPAIEGPMKRVARRYLATLSVAFFRSYVANQPSYTQYLTPAYATAITQAPLRLSLNQTLTSAQLNKALNSNKATTPIATQPPLEMP